MSINIVNLQFWQNTPVVEGGHKHCEGPIHLPPLSHAGLQVAEN